MTIRKNMGTFDRVARLIVGLALLGVSLFGAIGAGWDVAFVVAIVILLATATTGVCPGYVPFGISTQRALRPPASAPGDHTVADGSFTIEVENTTGLCPAGERYASQQLRDGTTPVLSCEGPCIRGEIARQAAHLIGRQPGFARACQGEAVAVPHSAMAKWIRESERVLVLDGCFLHCQGRLMRRQLRPDQLVELDALPLYRKYTDLFDIDSVTEPERLATARDVAEKVLERVRGNAA